MAIRAPILVLLLTAGLLVSPSPASAVRAVEEGWVQPFPVSSTIDVLDDFLVSGDLSTAVHAGCRRQHEPDRVDGVVFVDLASGAGTTVTGGPDSGCADQFTFEAPQPPFATHLAAVTDDGSALITTSWEGIEPGDADGGLRDVVLVDRHSGQPTLLSGGLSGGVEAFAVDISDDGSVALFRSYPATGDPQVRYHLWRNGVVGDLAIPEAAAPAFTNGGNVLRLSGDGGHLLAVGDLLVARIDLSSGAAVTNAYTGTCCGLAAVAISDDGRLVAWAGDGGSLDTDLFGPHVHVWDPSGVTTHPIAGLTEPLGTHDRLYFSGDATSCSAPPGPTANPATGAVGAVTSCGPSTVRPAPSGSSSTSAPRAPTGCGSRSCRRTAPGPSCPPWGRSGTSRRSPHGARRSGGDPPVPVGRLPRRPVTAGQRRHGGDRIERLYRAFFRRPADEPGRRFWIGKRLEGHRST